MGRRSRARRATRHRSRLTDTAGGRRRLPPRPAPLSDERPKAPWHPFPLVELCVLVGIVLIVLGLIVGFDSDRGQLALVCGVLLALARRARHRGARALRRLQVPLERARRPARRSSPPRVLFFARAPWIAVAVGAALVFALALLGLPHRVPPPLGRTVVPLT